VPITAVTTSVAQTRDVAAALAALARPGDLILLVGDLGAGKTAFAQGFGAALGVRDAITSPTFTLARQYTSGRIELNHLDVYRLEQLEEVLDLGLQELLDGTAVTLIEWGDAIVPALPADYLEVRLEFGADDDDRRITLRSVGSRWSGRAAAASSALAKWTVDEGAA
jgi:tRNA threonylcarbamoyladenosine biosynthesis protein TsaE